MAFKGEDDLPKAIILDLADHVFLLQNQCASDEDKAASKEHVMGLIKEHSMSNYYTFVMEKLGESPDKALVDEMKAKNDEELKGIEEKLTDAKENLGNTEVHDFMLQKADFFGRIGDKEAALEGYDECLAKSAQGLGPKLDVVFCKIRLGLFFNDTELVKKQVEVANDMLSKGGDWERRNRLKVYEGLYKMIMRDFAAAAELFLSALATFTCTELFEYERFIFYTAVLSLVSLDRATLRQKVIKAPEILSVYEKIPFLPDLMSGLYDSDYRGFFEALVGISTSIEKDIFLACHSRYFLREIRVVVYKQFLESYLSVTMDAMAKEFGITTAFLDREISHFIAAGRLNAKIDKVENVIMSNRPDAVNALYQKTIKQGDGLLNSIQKLTRVLNT